MFFSLYYSMPVSLSLSRISAYYCYEKDILLVLIVTDRKELCKVSLSHEERHIITKTTTTYLLPPSPPSSSGVSRFIELPHRSNSNRNMRLL